jgi:hypothetical protein
MEYLITESQYKLIVEVSKSKDFNEYSPEYEYKALAVLPDNYRKDEIGIVIFNGPNFNKSEYTQPNFSGGFIIFTGPNGEFEFPMKDVHKSLKSANPYVFGKDLKDLNYKKLKSLMKIPEDKFSVDSNTFTSKDINESLKIAFSDYWEPKTDDYSAGLRNIHTIGEKTDSNINWSIMNFFDTKDKVKELIKQKWEKEGSGDKIEWLSSVFQNDDKFLKKLLDIQWNSISSGVKRENDALKNLIGAFEKKGSEYEYETYPPGHLKDRIDSVDIGFKQNGRDFTFQVKPLGKIENLDNGETKISTYNMGDYYKNKSKLGYIMYNEGNKFIIFRNTDYKVSPDGREVIHYGKPISSNV